MAEGKKTFLMRVDEMHTFEKLSDEQAGKLIKHVFRYTNDLNPEPPNEIIDLVFEPIKQRLKNELVTWKKKCQKNKENIEKRWDTKDTSRTNGIRTNTKHTDKDKDKDKDKEVYIPPKDEFIKYARQIEMYNPSLELETSMKYDTWKADGWVDGNGNKIKNWKTKIRNTMPHFKGVQLKKVTW